MLATLILVGVVTDARAQQDPEKPLIVGSEEDYPPFAIGKKGEAASGFTVDLWKAVSAETGLNYAIRVQPFRQLLEEFKAGKIDVMINLAQSEERRAFADFSVPHVIVNGAVFVRKDESRIRSEADLAGKSIIVLNSDLAHDYAISKGWERQLVLVDTAADGLKRLASGQHDAMLLSKLAGMQTLLELKIRNVKALDAKAGFSQRFSFAVPKGRSELLAKINEGLALTKSSGTYDVLYEEWFGVFEAKEISFQQMLKYLGPITLVFLVFAGFLLVRQNERRKGVEALRRSHESLQEHRDQLREAQRIAGFGSWEHVLGSDALTWSDGLHLILGREPGLGPPTFATLSRFYTPASRERLRAAMAKAIETGESFELELEMIRNDGTICWTTTRGEAVRGPNGAVASLRGTVHDITERKQAEAVRTQLAAIVENSNDAIFSYALDGTIRSWNAGAERMLGYTAAEAIGKPIAFTLPPNRPPDPVPNSGALLRGEVVAHESDRLTRDGRTIPVLASDSPIRDGAGNIVGASVILQDITTLKQAQAAVMENERLIATLFANLPGMAYRCNNDKDWTMTIVSQGAKAVTGYEWGELHQNSAVSYGDLIHPEDRDALWSKCQASLDARTPCSNQYRIIAKSGDVRWVWERAEGVYAADGTLLAIEGFVQDITAHKHADEKMRAALAEKEVLLKEIYHRVKNNLQVVSSLLNLQSRSVKDTETKRLLDDNANRVKSMALVHEQLYRAENLSSIRLQEYLKRLTDSLTYTHQPLSTRVALSLEVDELTLGVESAIPLGLLVNELVSNAYRHGFAADAADGKIVVRLTALPGGQVCLEVRDNGCGLPKDFEPGKGGSLGMQLIATLSQQLGGELTWDEGRQGTRFALRFKPETSTAPHMLA